MGLSMDRQPRALPKRLPAGTVYVVEGRGGDRGNLRVSSRYVIMPSGEKVKIPVELAGTSIRVRPAAVFWMPPPARFPNQTIIGGNKKICSRDRNKAPKATLSVKRRAKPPSPSPSITRRRTPAVFAVGVLLFNHVRSRRARPAEPTNRRRIECSQVSCASVWCLARGRARRPPRGQVRSAFLFVQ